MDRMFYSPPNLNLCVVIITLNAMVWGGGLWEETIRSCGWSPHGISAVIKGSSKSCPAPPSPAQLPGEDTRKWHATQRKVLTRT